MRRRLTEHIAAQSATQHGATTNTRSHGQAHPDGDLRMKGGLFPTGWVLGAAKVTNGA